MSQKEKKRLEAAAAAYFADSRAAAIAAVSEVRVAGVYPEAARAMRAEFVEAGLSEWEAVLLHAIKRGYLWLAFDRHVAEELSPSERATSCL